MTRMTRLLSAAAFSLLAFAGARAGAQTCTADTDCPQSYLCVVSGTSTPPACKGTDCPADTGAAEPVIYKSCQPKDCATDADCGAGMVCYDEKTTTCSGGGSATSGCAPNTKCDAGLVVTTTPETCTTTSHKLCAFKWQVPCSADTDCGDGFVCQPSVSGGCGTSSRSGVSGSTGSAGGTAGSTSGGGSGPVAVDAGAPDCTTVTSFPGSCTPKATTCAADAVCPSGWTCTAIGTPQPVSGTGTGTPVRGTTTATAPAESVDAGGSTTKKICIGPFGAGAPTRGGIDVGTGGEVTNTGHQGTGGAAPPTGPGSSATGGTTGNATGAGKASGGGCAVAPARPGRSALLLMGFAAVGLALARRRQRK